MSDEEYKIRLDFDENGILSIPYLMRKYKISHAKSTEYIEMFSHISSNILKDKDGHIIGVEK